MSCSFWVLAGSSWVEHQSFQKADMHRHRMAMATSAVLLTEVDQSFNSSGDSECPTANPPSGHLAANHMPTICQPSKSPKTTREKCSTQHSDILGPPLPSSHSFEDGPRSIDVQLAGEILDQGCQDDLPMGSLTKYSNSHSSHILQQFLYFHDAPCTTGPKHII